MKIRVLDNSDRPRILELFESQNFTYDLPDLRSFVAAQVLEDEGQIIQAVLARPTVELYFLGDPEWRTPQWRMEALRKIHESMRLELRGKGFEDVHVFLPPEKEKSFGRRLMKSFHWTRPLWTCLTRPTAAVGEWKVG